MLAVQVRLRVTLYVLMMNGIWCLSKRNSITSWPLNSSDELRGMGAGVDWMGNDWPALVYSTCLILKTHPPLSTWCSQAPLPHSWWDRACFWTHNSKIPLAVSSAPRCHIPPVNIYKSAQECKTVTASPSVFAAITCSHKVEACACFCLPVVPRWTLSSE